jgi:hypothetical protein
VFSSLLSLYHSFILPQDSASTPQVDSDISDSISIGTVVETIGDHTTDSHMPSLPTSAKPIAIMPKAINLDVLCLHSPSSQIVGTPFANDNDNTRFEYPFPDTREACGSGSSPATSDFSIPATPASPSSNSFPTLSTSSQMLTQLSFPPSSHCPSYNPTHPKMKVQTNPPIPPTLVKRRLRWSMSLLGRRRSSGASQESTTSDELTMANITDGPQACSPPGSPIQEQAKR